MFATPRRSAAAPSSDVEEARHFYGDTLGIATSEQNSLMTLHLAGGRDLAWSTPSRITSRRPTRSSTSVVDDIDKAVDELAGRGVPVRAVRRLRARTSGG